MMEVHFCLNKTSEEAENLYMEEAGLGIWRDGPGGTGSGSSGVRG
jgi:hypothetical protein